ncbi:hypothetical protein DIU31_009230 [Mucilaginibacter rubeus]|uniref:Plasmid transfer protein n=1 Tax=Mucilaginibacter rubeus TaxID=2027860 RepID=A0AAE6JDR5_9SPHI|nr:MULTISPECIES: hypothetical protein [Mucilaginibacter]QEM03686.1 hypothetical protein DIU31_009230 [Mucilaginibacter rubeus]QEM16297.1 hypothetical protein DIU38_009325 [Mucilaginibacter gossypii]QTE40941.1 hypothetical protein J3L19_18440 [Mucilaginibacter rubeus]QTE47544.1 hypothetical protein J3L21_18415 [Mucilaginibacter rubeus]QTE58936.1 hypothetical protein J3L23_10080 [Mucilaginibacter rubeus]
MKNLIMIICLFSLSLPVMAQKNALDLPGMYQLINESQDEHSRQVAAKNQQAVNTANEQANETLLDKLKGVYRTIQNRYNALGTLISAADVGIYAVPVINRIVNNQQQIIALAQKNPAIIPLSYHTEVEFAEKAEALSGYVAGLILSYGDVNQMKQSDRKLLVDYIIQQLSRIQELSGNLLNLLQYSNLASVLKSVNPFQTWVDQDKSMVNNILQNAKYLK